MTPLYTESEFEKAKSRDLLRLCCEACGKDFLKVKSQIQATLASAKKDIKSKQSHSNKYCSKKCQFIGMTTEIKTSCGFCGISISKDQREVRKSRTGFSFVVDLVLQNIQTLTKSMAQEFQNLKFGWHKNLWLYILNINFILIRLMP